MSVVPDETGPRRTAAQTGAADDTHPDLWRSRNLVDWSSLLPWLAMIGVLAVLPLVFESSAALTIMNQMAIFTVFALSYNMLLGQGGMLSFGHAVYFGLGGFFCVHIMNWVEDYELWLPLPLLPILGGLFGMVFAFLVGSFQCRRAGTVFAMISLGINGLVFGLSVIIVAFFGGEEGISGDRTWGPSVFGWEFISKFEVYVLTAVWLVLSAVLMYLFSRTPMGRLANAVRDNEERAEFLGYSQHTVRWVSFTIAGFFAGVAGALSAINFERMGENDLNPILSGTILLVTFLGGAGFFIGPIVGAVTFVLLQTVLSLYTELWQLYVGLLFVITVMYFPAGLTGLVAMHREPWRNRRVGALALPYLSMAPFALAVILAFAAICEMALHMRVSSGSMNLYGLNVDPGDGWPMVIAVALLVGSAIALWRLAPRLRTAWDVASLERP